MNARPDGAVACAHAGIAAPILFAAVVLVQGAVHPSYSHVALPISALSALPGGWVQNANLIVSGALVMVFALGLHLGIRPIRGGFAGPLLLVVSGAGTAVLGVFRGVPQAERSSSRRATS